MLIFASIGMAGFLALLILWLWILPDRPAFPRWPTALAIALTLGGLAGTIASRWW